MTENQREHLREMLLSRRDDLRRSILARSGGYPGRGGVGDLDDLIDAALSQAQAVVLRVMDKEGRLLKRIERALAKFETGEYGLCEATGEPIGFPRLSVIPWARLCIATKERREREQFEDSACRPGR